MLRFVTRAMAISGAVFLLLVVRVVTSSREELAFATACRSRGDLDGAVVHYRRAAAYYAPANPFSDSALRSMMRIAREAEAGGHIEFALGTWRSVRAAIMQARSFYIPYSDRLQHADQRIAIITARIESQSSAHAADRNLTPDAVLREFRRDEDPNVLGSVFVLVGFLTWVASGFLFSVYAIDDESRIVPGVARKIATAFLVGFCVFLLGLIIA